MKKQIHICPIKRFYLLAAQTKAPVAAVLCTTDRIDAGKLAGINYLHTE